MWKKVQTKNNFYSAMHAQKIATLIAIKNRRLKQKKEKKKVLCIYNTFVSVTIMALRWDIHSDNVFFNIFFVFSAKHSHLLLQYVKAIIKWQIIFLFVWFDRSLFTSFRFTVFLWFFFFLNSMRMINVFVKHNELNCMVLLIIYPPHMAANLYKIIMFFFFKV